MLWPKASPWLWHESSSWVEIRLHTEFGRVWLCRSWDKVGYGLVVVCGFVVFHRKIRLTQLWVELSWVVAIFIYLFFGICLSSHWHWMNDYFLLNFVSFSFSIIKLWPRNVSSEPNLSVTLAGSVLSEKEKKKKNSNYKQINLKWLWHHSE